MPTWGNNVIFYVASVAGYALVFLILSRIASMLHHKGMRIRLVERDVNQKLQIILVVLVALTYTLLCIHRIMVTDFQEFGVDPSALIFHIFPEELLFIIMIPTVLVFLYRSRQEAGGMRALVCLCYGFALVISFVALYFPNMIATHLHHAVAYTETIFNVLHLVPYDIKTTGIYGHYALFYAPVLALFGGTSTALAGIIAAVGALVTLFLIYIIHNITSNNFIRIAAILATLVPTGVSRYVNYWQLQPHRIIWPVIIIAYIIFLNKRKFSAKYVVPGYVLCSLATVWNTEGGFICCAAYTFAIFADQIRKKDVSFGKVVLTTAANVFMSILSVLFAILIVNIYNIAVGGSLILKDFFFPVFEESYVIDGLTYGMIFRNSSWVYILILGLISVSFCLKNTPFFVVSKYAPDGQIPVLACTSAFVLGGFVYYANRAAYYNLDICYQLTCIELCIFSSRFQIDWRKLMKCDLPAGNVIKGVFAGVCTAALLCGAVQSLLILPNLQRKLGYLNAENMVNAAQELSENVPKDTFAFGPPSTYLYQQLGWDVQLHIRDFSDLSVGGMELY